MVEWTRVSIFWPRRAPRTKCEYHDEGHPLWLNAPRIRLKFAKISKEDFGNIWSSLFSKLERNYPPLTRPVLRQSLLYNLWDFCYAGIFGNLQAYERLPLSVVLCLGN